MKKFFSIIFLSLNIFCAEQSAAEWKYFKLIGGYENQIGTVVRAEMDDNESDIYNHTKTYIEIPKNRYLSLDPKPPKDGKVFLGGPDNLDTNYLYHESWLEDIDQKVARDKFMIQCFQALCSYLKRRYVKIIRGYSTLENKIAAIYEYDMDKMSEHLNESLLCKYLLCNPPDKGKIFFGDVTRRKKYFFHESWIEDIDQKIAKEQFGKQLEEEILSNPDYFE